MIKAEFKSYGSYTTDSVSQWDLNQKLTISGLDIDVAPVLAFSCFGMYESIIVQSKLSDGVITCDVPNAILQFGKNLNVDLCSETGGQYKAFEKMIIPVNRRKKPSDYLFTDNVPLSTAESIKADLEKEINSNKTYTDKVKAELKNDNKTLNGRIDTILTGTVNTTKLVTVHSATIRNNSASDLTFKISSKDNETLKSIKDKSPTVIDTNVIARALDGVAINGASIPSSYNVESTNDEYVITVYSGSSSVVGQYVFMAVATIAYKDTATDISSAELKDIRTGANGTTYPTAGDAVRGQIGDLKKELDDFNLDENVSQIQQKINDISQLKESLKDINVDTDKTLKVENKAADAKITGEKIETLDNTIGDISNKADYGNNVSEILDYLFENMGTDLPKAIVVSDDSLYIDETETGSFSVKLKSAPKESQNVYITATDPTKCNISPTTLSFSTENYNVEQTVTVTTLADTDTQDDIVTITVNSTGVTSKTVAVTILDKDKISLTEDGLVFEADYRNYVSGSETMEDTKAGITIQNIKGFKKVTNGIATDEVTKTYQSMYIDHTQENFQVLKEKMTKCAKNGFTLEAFGTAEVESFGINYKNSFWSDQGTTLLGYSSTGVSETNTSNLYARANAVYKDNNGKSQKTANSNTQQYVDTDGKTKGMNLTTFKFIHVCAVYNKDGTYTAYINGNPLSNINNVTVENWGSWDIDTMFNYHWTMGSSQGANIADGNFITFQRMYNRPLSLQEIKRNMKYNANECGITSF